MLTPTLLVVVVTYLAVGAVFGAIDVVVVGFAEAEGAPALSGAALAVFAGGSLVAGLVYGLARLPGTLAARFVGTRGRLRARRRSCCGPWARCRCSIGCGFLAGLTIAPVLVSGTSLVESRVAARLLTESLAWTITGLTLGVTAGSAAGRGGRRRLGRARPRSPSRRWPPALAGAARAGRRAAAAPAGAGRPDFRRAEAGAW